MHNLILTSCIDSDIKYINEIITTGIYVEYYKVVEMNKVIEISLLKSEN